MINLNKFRMDKYSIKTLYRNLILLIGLNLLVGQLMAAELTEIELKITQSVEKYKLSQIEHLEKVVNMNSGTLNIAGNQALAKVYQGLFAELAFSTQLVPLAKTVGRAEHFVASRQGTQGKRVLLIGHLDTVFEPPTEFTQFKRDGNRATGPGVVDMKGGNAIILFALQALFDAGALDNTSIQVVFPSDEESTGKPVAVSRQVLVDAAKASDVALAFEGGSQGLATIGRRGFSGWQLRVSGVRAHSSGIFNEKVGAGAVFEASRIFNEFYTQLSPQKNLTFNVGLVAGGNEVDFSNATLNATLSGKLNIVPQVLKAAGDLRYLSIEQRDQAIAKMQSIVSQHLPQTNATLEFENNFPPMEPTQGNIQLLKMYSQASEDLGLNSVVAGDPAKRGAGDISHVAHLVDSLDGLGAWGSGSHTTNEAIELDSLEVATKRAALLIYRLTR